MPDIFYRTIIICVVWISLAIFLTFGLPDIRPNGANGQDMLMMDIFFVFGTLIAGIFVTLVVWLTRRPREYTGSGFEVIPPASRIETK